MVPSGEHSEEAGHSLGATLRKSSAESKSTTRRMMGAVVIPGMAFGLLAMAGPAYADTAPTSGICNGVVNQLAHRGTVQENLLKAAAKKNADLIAKLQAERSALQGKATTLNGQI